MVRRTNYTINVIQSFINDERATVFNLQWGFFSINGNKTKAKISFLKPTEVVSLFGLAFWANLYSFYRLKSIDLHMWSRKFKPKSNFGLLSSLPFFHKQALPFQRDEFPTAFYIFSSFSNSNLLHRSSASLCPHHQTTYIRTYGIQACMHTYIQCYMHTYIHT